MQNQLLDKRNITDSPKSTAEALAIVQKYNRPVLLLCAHEAEIKQLHEEIKRHDDKLAVISFVGRETLLYDNIETASNINAQRIAALYQIAQLQKGIVLSTVANASHRLAPRNWLLAHCIMIECGQKQSMAGFTSSLQQGGYQRVDVVRSMGEYAVRGGLIDVFILEKQQPLRIEFFDNIIERLRYFDPITQRGNKTITQSVCLLPSTEYAQTTEAKDIFQKEWPKYFGGSIRGLLYERIIETGSAPGAEYYMPLFFEYTETLFNYLPKSTLWGQTADIKESSAEFWNILKQRIKERGEIKDYPLVPPENLFLSTEELLMHSAKTNIIKWPIEYNDNKTVHYQKSSSARPNRRFKAYAGESLAHLDQLSENDLVVHEAYGIGRYQGLKNITVDGIAEDYISLEYAANDMLYLPIRALSVIHKHNNAGVTDTALHSLRAKRWRRQLRKVSEQLEDLAADLIKTHARRANVSQGFNFCIPKEYASFCEEFPFDLTVDQERTIDEITVNLTAASPMDRLLCGDVGFGKTEVAMRAVFIAGYSNYQSVILAPTALLVEQHLRSFKKRFAEHPLEIAALSRNTTANAATLQDIASGKVDIIIGTHRILQKDLYFKRLGLVVIDEEHRFGVKQKEWFRKKRAEVNLLSMTATPIPRSLNISLNRLRDLSIIASPPSGRLPVNTAVRPYDRVIIREIIQREIQRSGQIYYLHNEIDSIERCADTLNKLVPQARIGIVHGQLHQNNVKTVMANFYDHHIDILVCTTIVESGLDVPNANTIIIERADLLGLAQLYQLRGRVGRSNRQAYAWLLTPTSGYVASKDSQRRLAAMVINTELGSGFSLATQDMEIRGTGDLLGKEQSGNINELGPNFYLRMLERTIKKVDLSEPNDTQANNEDDSARVDTEINLHLSALLEEAWIPDISLRLEFYQRIARADKQNELNDLYEEMKDRFGAVPENTYHLLHCSALYIRAKKLGIIKLDINQKRGEILFSENNCKVRPYRLARLLQENNLVTDSVRMIDAHCLYIKGEWTTPQQRLDCATQLLTELSPLKHLGLQKPAPSLK